MSDPTTVTVRILDKDYQVACAPEEVESLNAAARLLNDNMARIRETGKVVGLDRIAVMAALNIANDYLRIRSASTATEQFLDRRVVELTQRIDRVIEEHKPA